MNKTFFLLCCCLLLTLQVRSQLQVIQVKGLVTYKNEYVKSGQMLPANARLYFTNTSADFIRVIDAKGNTYKLNSSGKVSPGNNLSPEMKPPVFQLEKVVTLKEEEFEKRERFPEELISAYPVLIEQLNRYHYNREVYPASDSNHFYLQIHAVGQKNILRRLKIKKDTLVLLSRDFLSDLGNGPGVKYGLFFRRGATGDLQVVLDSFKVYFDQTKELEAMVAAMVRLYKKQKLERRDAYLRCLGQVEHNLGKPSRIDFSALFDGYYSGRMDSVKHLQPFGYGAIINFNRSGVKRLSVLKPHVSPFVPLTAAPLVKAYSLQPWASDNPGYQGKTGTCTAWASAYGARSITYNYLNNKDLEKPKWVFSPEFVYNQLQKNSAACKSGAVGITIPAALGVLKSSGDLIFTDTLFNCDRAVIPDDFGKASPYTISDQRSVFLWVNFKGGISRNIVDLIREQISVEKRPVIFSILVPKSHLSPKDGTILIPTSFEAMRYPPYPNQWLLTALEKTELSTRDTSHVSHCMVITGYDDTINKGVFEVLNSWGSQFGKGGYFLLNYDDFMNYAIDGFVILNPGDATSVTLAMDIQQPKKKK